MRFMMTFSLKPDRTVRDAAIARFRETGNQMPSGIKLVGRWTATDLSVGFDLLESADVRPLTEFALQWNDLMDLRVIPVVDDAELTETLKRVRA